MSKYIDADQIRAEIERRIKELDEQIVDIYDSKAVLRKDELQRLLSIIDTLPEQPVEKQEQPMSAKDKFVFPNFLYARTVDNKTIDVSYAPQSLDAVEYVKNNPTEQPVEGLEKEVISYLNEYSKANEGYPSVDEIARHFAEWGVEHLKK